MRIKKQLLALLVALIILGTALSCGERVEGEQRPTQNRRMVLSGTIEATEVILAAEVGGRIVEVTAEEGETVDEGALLIALDDRLMRERHEQAQAAVLEATGVLNAAQAQLDLAEAGARGGEIDSAMGAVAAAEANVALAESQLAVAEGRREAVAADVAAAEGQTASARAGVRGAEAELAVARAAQSKGEAGATPEEIAIAQHNLERAKNELWGRQNVRDAACGQPRAVDMGLCDLENARVQAAEEIVIIAEVELWQVRDGLREEDLASLAAQTSAAAAGVDAARARIEIAQAQTVGARAALKIVEADIEMAQAQIDAAVAQRDQSQAALDMLQEGARSEELVMRESDVLRAQASLQNAESQVRTVEVQLDMLSLRAPIQGEVLRSMVSVGELASPGAPLMVLADLEKLTLTVYVPQPDLGRVRLNQEIEVTVDAYPDVFYGRVSQIASRAEFAPGNVETREERVNMVFAVKIVLDNVDGLLKPGMPADATFR